MTTFHSNLDSNSRLHPHHITGATLAGGELISSAPMDPFLSHIPVQRAPFFSIYNVDESRNQCQTPGLDQVARAPFLSTYSVDESRNYQEPHSHAQVSKAPFLGTYNMDESPNHSRVHSQQPMPMAPFGSNQSFMDLSSDPNNDQVATEYLAQQKALSSSLQETPAPNARAPPPAFGAVSQHQNDAHVAEDAAPESLLRRLGKYVLGRC